MEKNNLKACTSFSQICPKKRGKKRNLTSELFLWKKYDAMERRKEAWKMKRGKERSEACFIFIINILSEMKIFRSHSIITNL